MRRAGVVGVALLFLVALGACGRSSEPSSTAAGADTTLGRHVLVESTGELAYKRPGWKEYVPLTFGFPLRQGDLLNIAPGASGVLVCSDLSVASLRGGYQGGVPCSQAKPVLKRGESLVIAPQRSATQVASIPYLLSPRHTFVQRADPLLRWASTGTGQIYTVRVWGGDVDWKAQASGTELRYAADAPTLKPGVPYLVSISDDQGRSSDEEGTALDLSFVLLSPDQVAAVQQLVQHAQGLGLGARATHLVEADIYDAQGLRSDAIELLVQLSAADGAPAVDQRLGDLYREIGLYAEAVDAYTAALAGFEAVSDPAGEAEVLASLGLAQSGDNDQAAARGSLTRARELYEALGDEKDVRQIDQLLTSIGGGG